MDGEIIADDLHDLAIEIEELDGMASRVFNADDWLHERQELRQRLESASMKLTAIIQEV